MRMPRVRFTIRRLMVAVLVSGLALWVVAAVWPIGSPTIPELQAQAAYQQAKLVREVAEYAFKEYQEAYRAGNYTYGQADVSGQIATARSDQERAIARLKWSSEMNERQGGVIIKPLYVVDPAEFDLEQAKTQLEVLEKYTKEKQIKSLWSDVEKARADELAKLATYQQERAKRQRFFGF